MRDHLAHRYFDTAHSIVQATVEVDLPPLVAAVQRLLNCTSSLDQGRTFGPNVLVNDRTIDRSSASSPTT